MRTLLSLIALLAAASSSHALSVGPVDATTQLACTFQTCGNPLGSANNACAVSTAGQTLDVGGFPLNVPASATSIDGIVVESRSGNAATIQLLVGGAPVGQSRMLQSAITNLCANTLYASLGGTTDTWGATLTAADANALGVRYVGGNGFLLDSVSVRVFFTIGTPVCGDGYQTGDEQCEDGNTERGDGCSAGCRFESDLLPEKEKCIVGMNKAASAIASASAKLTLACVKSAAKTPAVDADACRTADAKGTVAKAIAKLEDQHGKLCSDEPIWGYSGSIVSTAAATSSDADLTADVFGAPLDAAVVSTATDADAAKCQAAVLTSVGKVTATRHSLFRSCKQRLMKDDLALSGDDLIPCLDPATIAGGAEKVAKAVAGVAKAATTKCASVDRAAAFPGACASAATAEDFASCLNGLTACRFCRYADAVDALHADCDAFCP